MTIRANNGTGRLALVSITAPVMLTVWPSSMHLGDGAEQALADLACQALPTRRS